MGMNAARVAVAYLLLLAMMAAAAEEPAERQQRINRLIEALNSDQFTVRESAHRKLIEIGLPALPAVIQAKTHPSAEVRRRAQQIALQIQDTHLLARFRKLAATPADRDINLEEGMWLISQVLDPGIPRQSQSRQLDALADKVRDKLGKATPPPQHEPQKVIQAVRAVLFEQEKFDGNHAEYDSPDNSSLHRVLKTRKGLPILLSHLVVAVADRLEVPIVGVPIPSKYMVKYDGSQAPQGAPRQDILLDPFDGLGEVSQAELKEFLERRGFPYDPEQVLKPSSHRATLVRMLANLTSDLQAAGEHRRADQVARYRQILLDGAPQPPE